MPHPYNIKVTHRATGEIQECRGEFSDHDWARLASYLDCAWRLAACRFVETQAQLSWRMLGENDQPLRHDVTFPPEDDIAAFLHRMRPFVLVSEATSFYGVRNLLARQISAVGVRDYLERLKNLFAGEYFPFRVEVGSESGVEVLNSQMAVLKWLNAFGYHQDAEKQQELRALYRVFPQESARVVFLLMLLESASAVGKLGALIDGLSKRDGRELSTGESPGYSGDLVW